jgi:alanine-synthesizing transaminase
VKPKGAMYLFPKFDLKQFDFKNDGDFVLSLLEEQRILVVAGTGFNFKEPDHFRIVFLPHLEQLELALGKIGTHFENHRKGKPKS